MKTDDFTKKCPELVAILLGIGNNYTLIEQCDGGKLLDKIMNYYANSAENMQKRFYPNLRAIVIQPLAKRGYIGKLKNITNLFRPEQSSRIDLDSEINRGMYCYPNEQLDDWVWLITTLYASKGKQLSEAKEKNNEKIRKQKYNLLKKKFGDEADSYDVYVIVGSDTAADKRKLIKVADVNGQYADLALMFEMKVNAPVTERLWDYVRSAQNVDEQTVYVPIQGFPYSVKKNSNNNCELLPTGNDGAAFSPYKTCRTKTGADEDTILNNVVQSTFGSLIGILNSNQQQGKKLLQNGRRYTDGNNMSVNFSANGRTVVEKMLDVPNGDRGSMTIVAGINASDKLKKGTTEVNDDMNVLLQKEDAKFTQKPIFMENFMSTGVISTVVALPVTPKRTIQELTEAQLCILIQAYASVENKTKNFTLVPTWTAIKVETAQKHKYIDAKRNNRITNSKDAFPSFDLLANAVARDIPLLKQLLDGSLDKDKSFAYPNGGPAFGFLKDKDVVNNQDVQFWQLLSKIEQNAASTYQKGPVQFAKGDQKLWLYYVGNKSKAEPTQYQQIPLKNVPVSANCLRQIYNKCILDTQSLDPKKKTNATNILSELLQHNGVLWNYKSMNLLHYLLRIDNENSGTVQLAAIMQVEKCLSPDIEKKINGEHLTIDWLKKNLSALDAEFGYPAGITSIGVKNVALEDATSQSKTPGARTPPPAPVNTPDTKPSPVNDEKEPYNPIAKLRKVSPEEKSYEKQATKDRIELEELLGDSAAKASNIAKGIGEKIVAVVNNNSTNARHEHDRPRLKNTYQKLIANPLTLDTADLLQLKDILLKTIFPTSDFSTSKDDLMTTNLFGVYNTGSSALSSYVKFRKPFKNLEIPYVTTHQQKKDEIDEMLGKLQKHISTLIRSSELKDGGAALVLSAILDLVCTGKMVGNDIYCPDEDEGSAPFGMTGEIASVISRIMSNNVAEAE
jgi:hypothetical protein